MKTFRESCGRFDRMEIYEQVYEGQTHSKNTHMAYASHNSHFRNRNGGEAALPTNPEKGSAGKRKTKNSKTAQELITISTLEIKSWLEETRLINKKHRFKVCMKSFKHGRTEPLL